ncbi:MAG: hypothetical protein JXB35_16990 [Anaerolineae bacterium]|nr:hypothetical protein [Anaerolineae bacterium]
MKKLLIAYATNAGSTTDVARTIGEVLEEVVAQVDVRPMRDVTTLDGYDAVVVGAPMILGWHREAQAFHQQHQEALSRVPVACFMMALSLTRFEPVSYQGAAIFQDPQLATAPKNPERLSFKERFTSVPSYTKPAFICAPHVTPATIALFGGALVYRRLNLFQRMFVRLITGADEGDFRNWDAIREWAHDLPVALAAPAV